MLNLIVQIQLLDLFYLFIGAPGVILSLILFQKNNLPFRLLGFLTLLVVFDSISHIHIIKDAVFLINHGNLFLFGPLLYIFFVSVYDKQKTLKASVIHITPFVLIKSILLFVHIEKVTISIQASEIAGYFLGAYGLGYSFLCLFYLRGMKNKISKINAKYLLELNLIFLFGWVISLLARVFVNVSSDLGNIFWKVTYLTAGFFFYYITWSLIKNSKILSKKTYVYNTVNTDEERLRHLFEKEKVYLNSSLRLKDLSEKLSISTHELSYLLNQKLQVSFNDLINEYRVKEFQERLKEGNHTEYTFLSLAYESGFGSKASFQRAFKKLTGMTPKQYLKKSQIIK